MLTKRLSVSVVMAAPLVTSGATLHNYNKGIQIQTTKIVIFKLITLKLFQLSEQELNVLIIWAESVPPHPHMEQG